ncbi:hypothetical protein TREMEDRAFT_58253 [Tremella mesenterica DSM 1558]|uniref:uncharacterized protein n=1 Tax=Tremella mesenterica (strain ATCC 24925 / CBS 8224 / DSM 1558 / NBRC 9311 / NRRL Y-6157 / RJB 2259-6 / UBC 559-6) TaxID=578456 RepID=UPI0003F4921B|nr:uncharacterized protein TREMEDRAFT_58253 [Tremella mesenterica DSM 1558]EIW72100.1 hypothetical protein TREMEDRAFT_58253 [Tremella mesenterica DSM 1558]
MPNHTHTDSRTQTRPSRNGRGRRQESENQNTDRPGSHASDNTQQNPTLEWNTSVWADITKELNEQRIRNPGGERHCTATQSTAGVDDSTQSTTPGEVPLLPEEGFALQFDNQEYYPLTTQDSVGHSISDNGQGNHEAQSGWESDDTLW